MPEPAKAEPGIAGSAVAVSGVRSAFAAAKINLSLIVHGRRPDGYHALESLVVFASVGDRLRYEPTGDGGALATTTITGPFAAAIDGPNLIDRARAAFAQASGLAPTGHLTLEKHLPVAAGIGGGSADAAAALRIFQHEAKAAGHALPRGALLSLARSLGADVPVCLDGVPRMMWGVGEALGAPLSLPSLPAVLVNPRVPLATKDVFAALAAKPLGPDGAPEPEHPPALDATDPAAFDRLIDWLMVRGNSLAMPARRLNPQIANVLVWLQECPGVAYAGLSGSGPTCFALFPTVEQAAAATELLRAFAPQWWVQPALLGAAPPDNL